MSNISKEQKRAEIENTLLYFTGSENFYQYNLLSTVPVFIYTDGVKYVTEECKAHWLLAVIASYQATILQGTNTRLKEFQLWELKVDVETGRGVVTCREDSDVEPEITQEIKYTDFILPEITFYLTDSTLLLPSEY